jgi:hypothetical protein
MRRASVILCALDHALTWLRTAVIGSFSARLTKHPLPVRTGSLADPHTVIRQHNNITRTMRTVNEETTGYLKSIQSKTKIATETTGDGVAVQIPGTNAR